MTDAKHTPGPWGFGQGYKPGDTTFELFGPGGRQIIAKASYENMWLSTYNDVTDTANARLMASAPELLEALQLARDLFVNSDSACAEICDAAIAKALGESQ